MVFERKAQGPVRSSKCIILSVCQYCENLGDNTATDLHCTGLWTSFKITDQYLEVSVLSCAHKDELLAFREIRGSVKQIATYASN